MDAATILVVDDERSIRELVRLYLERDGYAVVAAETGTQALEVAAREIVDLIVLDLMLPDIAGEEVVRSLRTWSMVPIIVLTAKAREADRIGAFRLGVDDYVTKPFSPRELLIRVGHVLRRSRGWDPRTTSFDRGRLRIDPAERTVLVDGSRVALTPTEFDLLLVLSSSPGHVFRRNELLADAGLGLEGCERTVDAHVKNLRHKLGDDPRRPRYVRTVLGVGYAFDPERDAALV